MKTIVDPRDKVLFDLDAGAFSPLARKRLTASWPGVFRWVVLEQLPVDELALHFSQNFGRPTRELYSMAGLILIMEFLGWTAEQAADAYMFHREVQFALNLGPDRQSLCARGVERFKKIYRTDALAQQVMDRVTDALIAALELKLDRQRVDSTQVLSNMATFTRTRLMGVSIRRFLAELRKQQRQAYDALDAALRTRYEATENALFADVSRETAARRQLREEVAVELYALLTRFETHAQISAMKSFVALRIVFHQQCEVKDRQVVVRQKTGGRVLQNPSDPDATYDGHKGPGHKVQLVETCHPDNAVQLITVALPQTACETDSQALPVVLQQLATRQAIPTELVGDTHYGSDQNQQDCQGLGVELISPVYGPAPAATTKPPAAADTSEAAAKHRRLAVRREIQVTVGWRQRYRIRAGIESTNSGLKRRLGLGRLRVRGKSSVQHTILLKIVGWNILRAACSLKLRENIVRAARQVQSNTAEMAARLRCILSYAPPQLASLWSQARILCAFHSSIPQFKAA